MKEKDIIGLKFERLTVIEEVNPHVYPSGKKRRKFLCKCDCGNFKEVMINDLVQGHTKSCGCLNQEKRSQRRFKDLTGKTFGLLTVIKRVGTQYHAKNASYPTYLCQCQCGNFKIVNAQYLRDGSTKSCGCIFSIGEVKCKEFLLKNNIKFSEQVSFNDLISPNGFKLRFDFGIFDDLNNLKVLIEYQGPQHKYDIDFGRWNREITDQIKKKYCINKNLPLEEIWFNEDVELRLNQICSKYLHANSVPSVVKNNEGATTIP